ncbi:transcription repressor OFP3-like [Coffea eugenioides]|uniref:Transcription repressor n=1 Tax=Coffea arabica TaxID=13443 RepID=A0A6P6UJZ7_COFAR|nr:transcription repressor OFP3-like [Coffea arabica]XP_027179263.1 transcription repressor OFP3-like [Coffea eugenioides]
MGNYRFRLSDMMPNAWFYKLRDMSSRSRAASHPPAKKKSSSTSTKAPSQKSPYYLSQPRQSYYYSSDFSTKGSHQFRHGSTLPKGSDHLHFPDPPRRSSKRRTRRKTVYRPSPRRMNTTSFASDDHCNCHASSVTSVWLKPEQALVRDLFDSSTDSSVEPDFLRSPSSVFESDVIDAPESPNGLASRSSSCSCGFSSSATDIIIDVNAKSYTRKIEKLDAFDKMPELEDLPPILTKPAKFDDALEKAAKFRNSPKLERESAARHGSVSSKTVREETVKAKRETTSSPGTRKSVSHSTGIKLRANSPKLASKKIQGQGRKSVSGNRRSKTLQKKGFSESFAIVKASIDPEKDFRESMMEMIVENNIRASKDLEELLACYLSLNSDEYHELIIKAFEQIWFNMPDL